MRLNRTRYYKGKPLIETDFVDGKEWFVDLGRTSNSQLVLVVYKGDGTNCETSEYLSQTDQVLCPPEEDEITRHVRFPRSLGAYGSVESLLQDVDKLLARCLDLDERHRFLLACFVLSTWVVDRLPVAPYIALVGLPRSGKSTALNALYLLCRRGLITSDISSAAFYRACDRLTPTLCIDETATAGQKRTLFHLLRSGTTRAGVAFREGQSYSAYGAKVVAWTEMPDDDALNSRCITIPMQETSRADLKRTTDPEIIREADTLQGRLFLYRFQKYHTLKLLRIPGDERLRSRDRDLYEALALPISEDSKSCARLLECLEYQQDLNREPLPSSQMAVLESLFKQIHVQPDQEAYALRHLKNEVNLNLAESRERFHLNEKAVSGVLKTFGFLNRKRTNSGWVVLIDRAARKRAHELFSLYGLDAPSAHLPSQGACELCESSQVPDSTDPRPPWIQDLATKKPIETAPPADSSPSSREHSEQREHEKSAEKYPFSTKFVDGAEDEALIRALQADDPDDVPHFDLYPPYPNTDSSVA
jgi:ribosomal protein L34